MERKWLLVKILYCNDSFINKNHKRQQLAKALVIYEKREIDLTFFEKKIDGLEDLMDESEIEVEVYVVKMNGKEYYNVCDIKIPKRTFTDKIIGHLK